MRPPKLIMHLFIIEDSIKIVYHSHSRVGDTITVRTQPDQDTLRSLVYSIHQTDLPTALRNIILVNANLISPETPLRRSMPHPPKRPLNTLCQCERFSIADDFRRTTICAPAVRNSFILWIYIEVFEAEMTDQWLISSARLQRQNANRVV